MVAVAPRTGGTARIAKWDIARVVDAPPLVPGVAGRVPRRVPSDGESQDGERSEDQGDAFDHAWKLRCPHSDTCDAYRISASSLRESSQGAVPVRVPGVGHGKLLTLPGGQPLRP